MVLKLFHIIKYHFLLIALLVVYSCKITDVNNLNKAVIIINTQDSFAKIAAQVLSEEVEKRSGLKWEIRTKIPQNATPIILISRIQSKAIKAEGYHIKSKKNNSAQSVIIEGTDNRGLLFGVGKFLRMMEWKKGSVSFPENTDIISSPEYAMRGHQIAYRPLANSYDAWTPEIYDQYIRELAIFGTNSIEIVPFSGRGPLMKYDPFDMNVIISGICEKYDLDYWIMTGSGVDLADKKERDKIVAKHKKLYAALPRLNGVFFAGGDPGISHPKDVIPLLKELAKLLEQYPYCHQLKIHQSYSQCQFYHHIEPKP